MKDCKISILGAEWDVTFRLKRDDAYLRECNGYCDYTIRRIIVRKFRKPPKPGEYRDLTAHTKKSLRHEIVHAFLFESGLAYNTGKYSAWAANEEMVDWIAFQHEKLHKAFKEAGAV